jgi:hypothetical protein
MPELPLDHDEGHAHAIEMAHEGIPLPIIQRHLGITSIYLQGIGPRRLIDDALLRLGAPRHAGPRAGRDRQGHEFSDRYASQKLDDRRMRYPHQAFAGAGRVEAETLEERQFVVTGVADDLSGTDISSALLHLGVHRGADPRAL